MLSIHLPIFSTHLPTSRRKLSRSTASLQSVGVCTNLGRRDVISHSVAVVESRGDKCVDLPDFLCGVMVKPYHRQLSGATSEHLEMMF